MNLKRPAHYAFIDVESTNGSHSNGYVISLACIIADGNTLELKDKIVLYGRPTDFNSWNSYSEGIHGISKERAKTFPSQKEMCVSLLHFLKQYKNEDNSPIPFIYHGKNKSDFKFVKCTYEREGLISSFDKVFSVNHVLSTCEMFGMFLALHGLHSESLGLKNMAKFFNIRLDHHEVMSDTMACYTGFTKMAQSFNLTC